MTAVSRLRQALDAEIEECAEYGVKVSMKDLTVLAVQNDPFRIDTLSAHRDGEWLAVTAARLGLGTRLIHLRGLHYMLLGEPKPDGTPYTNTESDWLWLSGDAGKAARWLGYIPFDQIVDQRNAAPVIQVNNKPYPRAYLSVGLRVDIPDADDLLPEPWLFEFEGTQPYKLILIGEKSSLEPVLSPIANTFGADLYLPTGEMSDTLIHRIAKTGADDGRPMVVLYFADCDPSGWQMPISVARKLQALNTLSYPALEFQVHRVALTPTQVREYGLPSTPLKDTERRADKWSAATGVAQTEIDALASLRPTLLDNLARAAVAPFYDFDLDRRVSEAKSAWLVEAREALESGDTDLQLLHELAEDKLENLRAEIDRLNNELRVSVDDFDLPEIPPIPEPDVDEDAYPLPLLDSRWSFAEQCKKLIDSKAYRQNGTVA